MCQPLELDKLTAEPVPGGMTNPGVTAVISRLPDPPAANISKEASAFTETV